MPGFDGTGPQGRGALTGRRFGKCRPMYRTEEQPVVFNGEKQKEFEETFPVIRPPIQGQNQVYGVGRGGTPCGCGRGLAFGRRRGRGSW